MILLICFGIMLYVQIKQTTKSEEDQKRIDTPYSKLIIF